MLVLELIFYNCTRTLFKNKSNNFIVSQLCCGYLGYTVKVIKIYLILFWLQTMYLFKFGGENPTGSEEKAQKRLILPFFKDIENQSISPKSCQSKIRNRYNQVPHLTQDTDGKRTNSQLNTTNESQEVSPIPAGDHKAHINRRAQRHSKHKTEQKHKRSTKEGPPWNGQ